MVDQVVAHLANADVGQRFEIVAIPALEAEIAVNVGLFGEVQPDVAVVVPAVAQLDRTGVGGRLRRVVIARVAPAVAIRIEVAIRLVVETVAAGQRCRTGVGVARVAHAVFVRVAL